MSKLINYGYQLTEAQIRYAIENTTSNSEAAAWLHVTIPTWKKYASLYIDEESGKSLFELHKKTGARKRLILPKTRYKRRSCNIPHAFQPIPIEDIFANKHPNYAKYRFKARLIKDGWKQERCDCCGFQERRKYDLEVPIRMHWRDGNKENFALENIEFLCFNCFFINVGNPWGADKHFVIDDESGEPVLAHHKDPRLVSTQVVKVGRGTRTNTHQHDLVD
jgi:hypothetical protein